MSGLGSNLPSSRASENSSGNSDRTYDSDLEAYRREPPSSVAGVRVGGPRAESSNRFDLNRSIGVQNVARGLGIDHRNYTDDQVMHMASLSEWRVRPERSDQIANEHRRREQTGHESQRSRGSTRWANSETLVGSSSGGGEYSSDGYQSDESW